jgi:hypothetical protein
MFNNIIEINNFSLDVICPSFLVKKIVINGNEYYSIPYNSEYKLKLGNKRNAACNAEVYIDSIHVGTWRINPYNIITIEQPVHVNRKFTFVNKDNNEYEEDQDQVIKKNENGLIKVIFKPAKIIYRELYTKYTYDSVPNSGSMFIDSYNGINKVKNSTLYSSQSFINNITQKYNFTDSTTVLDNKSNQYFNSAKHLTDIDTFNITIIYARLIADNFEQHKSRFISLDSAIANSNCIPSNLSSTIQHSFGRMC